jgi:hypothetical protein
LHALMANPLKLLFRYAPSNALLIEADVQPIWGGFTFPQNVIPTHDRSDRIG